MKKLLATIMALVMALTLVPAAWADGENDNSGTTKAELTWDAATSTYTVTGDVTPTGNQIVIPANATVTLQLDGTLNASIVNKGNLTIQGDGTVNVTTKKRAAIENFPDATAAVNGGTYMSQHWYVIKNMGTMTIDGNVTVKVAENNNNPSSLIDNGWVGETDTVADGSVSAQTDKAKLYIKSGDFSGKSGSKSCSVIKNDDCGYLEISGGTFDSTINTGAANSTTLLNWNVAKISGGTFIGQYPISNGAYTGDKDKGELTISGGSFTGKSNLFGLCENGSGKGAVTISGGTFTAPAWGGDYSTVTGGYTVSVSGGTFNVDPSDFVANGYVANGTNGTWTVTEFTSGETKTTTETKDGKTETTVDKVNIDTTATKATTVEIDAKDNSPEGKTAAETTVTITTGVAEDLKSDKVEKVEVVTNVGTLTIDQNALKTLTEKEGALVLSVSKSGETTTEKTFKLTAQVDGVDVFKDSKGKITVTVPMDAPGFRQQIVCYYVDGNTRTRMGGAGYKDGNFSWDTNHFSTFVIVTETVSNSRASINISGSSTGTTATTTTTTGKASSATTFDAGVGIYAVSAILSVTGMAWVGKKH